MASKQDFLNSIYQAALRAGLSEPAARITAQQAGLESAYGTQAPGYNYFGITKGADWNGPTLGRADKDAQGNPITQQFRSYGSADEGIADRVKYMDAHFPQFNQAQTNSDALNALQNGRYGKYYTTDQATYEKGLASAGQYLPPQQQTSSQNTMKIVDLSGNYPYLAHGPMQSIQGLVVHHTGTPDDATPQSIAAGWKSTGNSSQYVMGRDGTVYRMVPDGERAYQTKASWNPKIPWASNSTTQGIELIAKDDKDVTPAQVQALRQFALQQAKTYGYDPATHVVGHGEINGYGAPPGTNGAYIRQPTEGMTAVNSLRNYLQQNPGASTAPAAQTAQDAINTVFPRAMPSQIASAYAQQAPGLKSLPTGGAFTGGWGSTGLSALQPTPAQVPASITVHGGSSPAQPTPPPPSLPQQTVRLASGNYIAPGIYNQGDHSVQVSDDGSGNALIQRVHGPMSVPGLFDPMQEANADTVAGGMIRSMLPKIITDNASAFTSQAPQLVDNARNAAVSAASNLGNAAQGFGSNIFGSIGGGLGSLFGGAPRIGGLSALGSAYASGQPISGLAALSPQPVYANRSVPVTIPPPPSGNPGDSFLQAQGYNTQDLTAGQQANALMSSITGRQRGSFGAGNV